MAKNNKNEKNISKTRINIDALLEGDSNFLYHLELAGKYIGTLNSSDKGFLEVLDSAEIIGDINVSNVINYGKIDGNIKSNSKVELLFSSQTKGIIFSSLIKIEQGALFEGSCKMLKDENGNDLNADSINIFSMPLEKLRILLKDNNTNNT